MFKSIKMTFVETWLTQKLLLQIIKLTNNNKPLLALSSLKYLKVIECTGKKNHTDTNSFSHLGKYLCTNALYRC